MGEKSGLLTLIRDELLPDLTGLTARSMFGSIGLYLNGVFVGIIDDERLYLKADDTTAPYFRDAGSIQFSYRSRGKVVFLPFWEIPADGLEDAVTCRAWFNRAFTAAKQNSDRKTAKDRE